MNEKQIKLKQIRLKKSDGNESTTRRRYDWHTTTKTKGCLTRDNKQNFPKMGSTIQRIDTAGSLPQRRRGASQETINKISQKMGSTIQRIDTTGSLPQQQRGASQETINKISQNGLNYSANRYDWHTTTNNMKKVFSF